MTSNLSKQYEQKIRPCIDLIDSLRALGVEKDLGLPAIAVIGDQSSGKSSVLEALSGVTLPRGSGIVTRCPLELRLKKASEDDEWSGKIKYRDETITLSSAAEVEDEVKKAQNVIAGNDNGVSDELIRLEVASPDVPDLTLIDLPGITRIALPNQPRDIGQQIKQMITKYIKKQQTIALVVVPSNVDIATNEALDMARQVDPNGERTLGILTKPDLVDRGTENNVVDVVLNHVYELKKGYMIVKCRGQQEIQDKITLEEALKKEKIFFEEHEHFSFLLEEGYATIPLLAEKLTTELVEHIHANLPLLEDQIKTQLENAEEKLKWLGTATPDTDSERRSFLIEKINLYTNEIMNATKGEEEIAKGYLRLFTQTRRLFNYWESALRNSCTEFPRALKNDMDSYDTQHRGRELIGFVNYKTFEDIVRKHIKTFEEPALKKLKEVTASVQTSFSGIASKHLLAYPNLHRAAKIIMEDICKFQQQEAETSLRTHFKMENVIYCQDTIYSGSLKKAREDISLEVASKSILTSVHTSQLQLTVKEMSYHTAAYFKGATNRLSNQVPLIIQYYVLHEFANKLRIKMLNLVNEPEKINFLLHEKSDIGRQRSNLQDKIKRLNAARRRLARFPEVDYLEDFPKKLETVSKEKQAKKRVTQENGKAGSSGKRKSVSNWMK
uniref:Interferon-induced GTP-binding protein Mx n=1 Tax=Leptobrachium leishanense TaxID=445787 RepID=A0A8C5LYS6_9ANUR